MQLEQKQTLSQKLVLTQTMRQSLDCLQLSAPELTEYVQEVALSNPLLDVQSPTYYETELPSEAAPAEREPLEVRETDSWRGVTSSGMEDVQDFTAFLTREKTFRDHLTEQIGQMKLVDDELLRLCRFLIDCLDERGYLDCPLDELAQECGCPLFDLEQALFVIQTLDPPGIGARDLTECLLLQLAQTSHFSASTVHLIRYGLPLLAQRDYKGLSALLELPERDAKAAAEVIRSLNPIPSNGFASQTPQPYTVPEAVIHRDGGRLSVELYARRWRHLSCNQAYLSMIGSAAYHEAQDYLKQKKREAEELIAAVEGRDQLIQQIIEYIASTQRPHLLSGQPLQPMTMSDLAQALRVNVSTISRAIREKYILLDTKVVLLRSLFSARLETSSGMAVSAEYAKMQVKRIIDAEDKAAPLSDQAISEAMQGMGVPDDDQTNGMQRMAVEKLAEAGITLSRRTVASYRSQMGIPCTQKRKILK